MTLNQTLQHVIEAGTSSWSRGENLSRLRVSPAHLEQLARGLRHHQTRDALWGACLILYGARVFHDVANDPFTYDTIGRKLGFPALADSIGQEERDKMEQGLRHFLGLGPLRSSGRRRFISTMLIHSGASWRVVDELGRFVAQRWSWPGVDSASLEDVAAYIDERVHAADGFMRRMLEPEEGRYAAADLLKSVARAVMVIEGRGWRRESWAATKTEIERSARLTDILAAPDDATAGRVLASALKLMKLEDDGAFAWRWQVAPGLAPRVVLRPPERLSAARVRLPPTVDRMRLRVVGIEADVGLPLYCRDGEYFRRANAHDLSVLSLNPAAVVAEYRSVSGVSEVPVEVHSFAPEVAVFDIDSGDSAMRPLPGRRIAIVAAPGVSLEAPKEFAAVQARPAGLSAWTGIAPNGPLVLRGTSAGGPIEHIVALQGRSPVITLPSSPYPDVRHRNAPCFLRWPLPRVAETDAIVTIVGPGGRNIPCRARWGEVVPYDATPPGAYAVVAEVCGVRSTKRFAILPACTFSAASTEAGTSLSVEGRHLAPNLRCLTRPESGRGRLELGPDVVGVVDVALSLLDGALDLVWRVHAAPRRVDVVRAPDAPPTSSRDLRLLRGGGGLRVRGPAGTSFRVLAHDLVWTRTLGPDGQRFFPFTELASADVDDDQAPTIRIGWSDGPTQDLGRFTDCAAKSPRHWLNRSAGTVQVEVAGLGTSDVSNVALEVVRAWEPWSPRLHRVTRIHPAGAGMRVEARHDVAGPAHIAVMRDSLRITGVALVEAAPGAAPPDDPLCQSLWRGVPNPRLVADRLEGAGGEPILLGLLRNFRRYGAHWFTIAGAVAEATTWRALPALVRGEPVGELEELLDAFRGEMNIPAFAIRYADFERVPAPTVPIELKRALQVLDSARSGLLMAAWTCWGKHVSDECAEAVAPLLNRWQEASEWLWDLSEGDDDLLRMPTEPLHDHEACHCGSKRNYELCCRDRDEGLRAQIERARPRMVGLVEVRRELGLRGGRHVLTRRDRALDAAVQMADACPIQTLLKPLQSRHAEVARGEHAALRAAQEIHAWRSGEPSARPQWEQLGAVWRTFPHAVDFWLNRFAINPDANVARPLPPQSLTPRSR